MKTIHKTIIATLVFVGVLFGGKGILHAQEVTADQLKIQILQLITQIQAQIIQMSTGQGGTGTTTTPLPEGSTPLVIPSDTVCTLRYQGQTDITVIQQELKNQGYAVEKVDGKLGPNTAAAVTAFQTAAGITADGKIGKQTRRSLAEKSMACIGETGVTQGTEPAVSVAGSMCSLRYQGQTDIAVIQQELKNQGYAVEKVDGKLGPNTAAAVTAFQTAAGITADGKIGAETRKNLTRRSLACEGDETSSSSTPAGPVQGPTQPEPPTSDNGSGEPTGQASFKKTEITTGTRSSTGAPQDDTGVFTFRLEYNGEGSAYIPSAPEQTFAVAFFNQSGNPVSANSATLSIVSDAEKILRADGTSWYRLQKGNTLSLRASIIPGAGSYYAELFRLTYTTQNAKEVLNPQMQNSSLTPSTAWRSAVVSLTQ